MGKIINSRTLKLLKGFSSYLHETQIILTIKHCKIVKCFTHLLRLHCKNYLKQNKTKKINQQFYSQTLSTRKLNYVREQLVAPSQTVNWARKTKPC